MDHQNGVKNGKITGTGSAITIKIGFDPTVVDLFNAEGLCFLHWTSAMGAGYGYKVLTGIDATADTVSKHSFISTGGVTVTAGGAGFTIGTDSDINVNGEDIYYTAWE